MFSENLKQLRISAGLTQVEFANIFHIATGTIAMWETGKREPKLEMIKKIADYFNVSVDYLLGISEEIGTKKAPTEDGERDELVDAIMAIVKQLSPEQKEMLLAQLRGLAGQK